MIALRPVAIAMNLIDRPGGRKLHIGDVPVVGGIAMLLGMVLGMGLVPLSDQISGSLLAASAILVTVGLLDDRFELSPWARLPVQIVAALVLIMGAGVTIETLGAPFGETYRLEGLTSYLFTIFVVVASINAFNMLDGMDGLAGALAMVALAALAILAQSGGDIPTLAVCVVIMGAVAAFLVSNLPIHVNRDVRCFMGDSGSTLLGFLVVWLCISVSQDPTPAAHPVTVLWVVAIPLIDLFWTVIRRNLRGISPFKPDNGHLHHLVLRAGFDVRTAFVLLVLLAILLAAFGISLEHLGLPDAWSLTLLVAVGAVIVRVLYFPELLRKIVPQAFHRIPPTVPEQ
jgi:UDP-GlcNAc:undecaprenyl-phosphate GlcNAc-1-phosphate transferase